MAVDLLLDVLVLLLNHVDLGVQGVDVVVQGVVLLLGLDEGGHDFFGGGDASLLLDLRESVFDDVDVTDVHVHQVLLLLVVGGPLLESQLEEGHGVGEFTSVGRFILGGSLVKALGLGLLHLGVVSLLELILE